MSYTSFKSRLCFHSYGLNNFHLRKFVEKLVGGVYFFFQDCTYDYCFNNPIAFTTTLIWKFRILCPLSIEWNLKFWNIQILKLCDRISQILCCTTIINTCLVNWEVAASTNTSMNSRLNVQILLKLVLHINPQSICQIRSFWNSPRNSILDVDQ